MRSDRCFAACAAQPEGRIAGAHPGARSDGVQQVLQAVSTRQPIAMSSQLTSVPQARCLTVFVARTSKANTDEDFQPGANDESACCLSCSKPATFHVLQVKECARPARHCVDGVPHGGAAGLLGRPLRRVRARRRERRRRQRRRRGVRGGGAGGHIPGHQRIDCGAAGGLALKIVLLSMRNPLCVLAGQA